ncbi:hypothetical protein GEV33_001784 [Tenebrio molitor]|uniref:Uncharacterized protein n=1 Tax=Tenebrio molitor TaxID=7067 RepID=A0A8J6HVE5_TENMO|nr:hypothetical protein GEV33_001784 [Tenebrio molitor]
METLRSLTKEWICGSPMKDSCRTARRGADFAVHSRHEHVTEGLIQSFKDVYRNGTTNACRTVNPSRRKRTRTSAKKSALRGSEGYKSREPGTKRGSSRLFAVWADKDFTTEGLRTERLVDQDLVRSCQSRSSPDSPEAGSDLVSIELSASTKTSCDSSCRSAVNPELAERKEEELDILPSPEGGVIVLTSEKGSAFHPLIISRLAVNGVRRLARWVHVKQGRSCKPAPAMGHGDGKDDPGGGNSIVVRIRREGDDNFSVVEGDDGRMDHDSDNEDRHSVRCMTRLVEQDGEKIKIPGKQ